MAVELHGHQTKALREMHNGCVLRGEVGSGKTITAMAYYVIKVCGGTYKVNGKGDINPMTTPKDVYVITTARKRDSLDWEKEAAAFAISTDRENSYNGVKFTVDSWNNLASYEGVKDAFFIFDEQRLVGSGAWVRVFLKIAKQNEWIMLSATPGDTWMDYVPIFVANGFYKNRTEFLRTHVVWNRFAKFPKVDRYVETGRLERQRRHVLVEMPFVRHTKRHVQNIIVEYDKEEYDNTTSSRWNPFKDEPCRDIAELFSVWRRIVNSDVSRLGAVMELHEKHPRLIIFYNFDYELEMLRTLGKSLGVPIAEWNGHRHEEIPETEKWIYLVQYAAGSEAWNCVSTDAMVFFSLNYSWKVNEQCRGRIDRINTPFVDLYYYYLRTSAGIDSAILRSLTAKKDFNEKEYLVRQ